MDDVYMCSKSETAQLATKPCIHVFIHDGKDDVDLGLPSAIADISHHHSGGVLFSKQCFFHVERKTFANVGYYVCLQPSFASSTNFYL